jgi:hypothetical protein
MNRFTRVVGRGRTDLMACLTKSQGWDDEIPQVE